MGEHVKNFLHGEKSSHLSEISLRWREISAGWDESILIKTICFYAPFCRDLTQVRRLTRVGRFFSYKQLLSSGFIEWSCVEVITATLRRHEGDSFGQVKNSEIAETTEITEIAVEQGNYKFCQEKKRKTNTKANLIKFEKKTCKIKIFRDFRVFVLCPTAEYENSQITKMLQKRRNQFVIFNPLSHCFKETIGFNVKTSRAASRLIMWCN